MDEDHFSIHSDIDFLEDIDNKSVGVGCELCFCLCFDCFLLLLIVESKPRRTTRVDDHQVHCTPTITFEPKSGRV